MFYRFTSNVASLDSLIQLILAWYTIMQTSVIKDPEVLGGEPVFRGTRVPFKILLEYLEGGEKLDEFLEQYPSVSRELAVSALEEARLSLVSRLK